MNEQNQMEIVYLPLIVSRFKNCLLLVAGRAHIVHIHTHGRSASFQSALISNVRMLLYVYLSHWFGLVFPLIMRNVSH